MRRSFGIFNAQGDSGRRKKMTRRCILPAVPRGIKVKVAGGIKVKL